jgi:hypothetical protein
MKASQADIPNKLFLPIPLTAAYQNLVFRIIYSEMFPRNNLLVYVILLPLTNHENYQVYLVLPLPINIRNATNKFIFILPEHEYLLMDIGIEYLLYMEIFYGVIRSVHWMRTRVLLRRSDATFLRDYRVLPR